MSRYRKTMAEAYGAVVENSAIQMQIAALKKAYEPMRNKKISMDNANKLMKIMDKFDGDKNLLSMMYKADIPFVSGLASARLISKHNFKAQQLMQIRKEDVDKLTDEVKQFKIQTDKKNELWFYRPLGKIEFMTKKVTKNFTKNIVYKETVITTSLYDSAINFGIKANIIIEIERL